MTLSIFSSVFSNKDGDITLGLMTRKRQDVHRVTAAWSTAVIITNLQCSYSLRGNTIYKLLFLGFLHSKGFSNWFSLTEEKRNMIKFNGGAGNTESLGVTVIKAKMHFYPSFILLFVTLSTIDKY